MPFLRFLFLSSPGKKLLNGATGLLLVGFVVVHLIGNFTFLMGPAAFNGYARTLETIGHGWILHAAEVLLLLFFVLHAVAGVVVWLDKRRARGTGYAEARDAGAPSRKTFSSRTMIWTGILLGVFTCLHVKMFRFGPARVDPAGVRDLYGLVVQAFRSPWTTWLYVGAMAGLGFHLRHGFWSMLQSLGWMNARATPGWWTAGLVFGIVMAAGFLLLPLYIHYLVDPGLGRALAGGGP
jgi:succinate dehydrogenase / fumarate reductase cytochrome b subunit